MRHQRTMHGLPYVTKCTICQMNFNRKDNLERHMKTHEENRKASENKGESEKGPGKRKSEEISQPSKKQRTIQSLDIADDIQNPEQEISTESKGKCNWCTQHKPLLPGKKFCQMCSDAGRECSWCHRPLPERFYSQRTDVCDTCLNRRERWNAQRGGGSQSALKGAVETKVLEPTPGNLWDILQFCKDNSEIFIFFLIFTKVLNVVSPFFIFCEFFHLF